MSAVKTVLITLLTGVLSIGIAVVGERWLGARQDDAASAHRARSPLAALPSFRLPDVDGREISSRSWMGKVVVLHYWAPWCPVCVEQLPTLTDSHRRHAQAPVQIVGIAIDRAENVARFLEDSPLDYPVLIGNQEAIALTRRLGNRVQGLPFTVLFDRAGERVFGRTGALERDDLERHLQRLLAAAAPADRQ